MSNPSSVRAATSASPKSRTSIVTIKRTINALPNARSPALPVVKPSTTSHLTMLIFAPRIINPPLALLRENVPLQHLLTHLLRKDLRGRTKQVRVPLQNQPPRQVLKKPSLVQVGNLIQFLFHPTLLPAVKKTLPRCTDSTGRKFEPDSAAKPFNAEIGIISVYPPSTQPASENSWTAFLLISIPCLKFNLAFGFILRNTETGAPQALRLGLSCATQKLAPSSTTTSPPIIT